MKLKPIDQQVIVLVGCTSGIGLETARRFARKGARQLVLAGIGPSDLEQTLNDVRMEGGDGITVEADVADFNQVQNIARRAVDTYGRIDTWAHVAAVPYYAKFEDMVADEFRRVVEVNLNGPTYGMMVALPYLKREGRGSIIIVSAVDAIIPVPYQSAYAAAKHGLKGMIETLRIELRHDRVPVSITEIIPASVNTPLFEKALTRTGFEPNAIPPVYDAASVADAIIYASIHRVSTISIGSASITHQASRRISPRLNDAMVMAATFKDQETDIPKSPDAPNDLYNHLEGYHRVEGKYPSHYSITTWIQLHPILSLAAGTLLLVTLPVGIYLMMRSRAKKSISRRFALNLGNIAIIGAIANFISNLLPRRKSLPRRVLDQAQKVNPFQKTMPEKFMSKVQDIMPKSILPSQKSFPEKALNRIKNMSPKGIFGGRRKSIRERVMVRVQEMNPVDFMDGRRKSTPEKIYSSAKETVQERISSMRG